MDAFTSFRAPLSVLRDDNVDTDQIIPARFLVTTGRAGLGEACFAERRSDPRFPLREGPQVLLAGHNFGCGSSREHAPWALRGFGIRAVVSTGIADIFRSNALKNGLLPVQVDADAWARCAACEGQPVEVDLSARELRLPDGGRIGFAIDAFARECLLRGVDELGYLLAHAGAIDAFERQAA